MLKLSILIKACLYSFFEHKGAACRNEKIYEDSLEAKLMLHKGQCIMLLSSVLFTPEGDLLLPGSKETRKSEKKTGALLAKSC